MRSSTPVQGLQTASLDVTGWPKWYFTTYLPLPRRGCWSWGQCDTLFSGNKWVMKYPLKDKIRKTGSLLIHLKLEPLSTCFINYNYETRWPKWTGKSTDAADGFVDIMTWPELRRDRKKSFRFFFELCALCIRVLQALRNRLHQTVFSKFDREHAFSSLFYFGPYLVPLGRKWKSVRKSVFPVEFEKRFGAIGSWEPGESLYRGRIVRKKFENFFSRPAN